MSVCTCHCVGVWECEYEWEWEWVPNLRNYIPVSRTFKTHEQRDLKIAGLEAGRRVHVEISACNFSKMHKHDLKNAL